MENIELLDQKNTKTKPKNSVSRLFGIGFIIFFVLGLIFSFLLSNSAVDLQLHDTYLVILSGQILLLIAFIFGIYSLIYKYIPKLSFSKLNSVLGRTHFWGTLICILIIIHAFVYLSFTGIPRRYYSFESFDAFSYSRSVYKAITLSMLGLFVFQFIFLLNAILCLFRKAPKH